VLTADTITGPYSLVQTDLRPLGMSAGDFDLVVSPTDGKGYQYFERVHSELICADLTDDYTGVSGYYSTHFPQRAPPAVRESPAYFARGGRHYLTTSGTTGYFPNPSAIAVADTFHGPWSMVGDLHPGDRSLTSFNSQVSSVFRHPGKKDLYIAMADRWLPDFAHKHGTMFSSGQASREVQSAFARMFHVKPGDFTSQEKAMLDSEGPEFNTSQSRYVWLPLRFDAKHPYIQWRDEWHIEEFA